MATPAGKREARGKKNIPRELRFAIREILFEKG